MSHFDYFVAQLECPHCRAISPKDASTGMHTYIRDPPYPHPGVGCLGVGDFLSDVDDCDIHYESANYFTIHEPNWDEGIRMLHSWTCASCRSLDNWAEIVVRRHMIESISPTRLTRDVFERSHFIKDMDAESLAARLTGRSWKDLSDSGADLVQILREQLH